MPKKQHKQPEPEQPIEAVPDPDDAPVEQIEEVQDVDEVPISENIGVPADIDPATLQRAAALVREQTRGERKARKVFEGLGLVPVSGISRVVFRRPRNELIVIAEPEVYKSIAADVYIVYGTATLANGNLAPQAAAAERFARQQAAMAAAAGAEGKHGAHDATATLSEATGIEETAAAEEGGADAGDAGEDADADGVDPTDIEMVVSQANVSRGAAITALKKNKGDVVNAIMELTS